MKVGFAMDVLQEDATWAVLDQIVYMLWERRHAWDVRDSWEIEQSNWIQSDLKGRAGKRNLETLAKFVTQSAYPSSGRMHSLTIDVTLSPQEPNELTPGDAIRCLQAPAYVLVENSTSDGGFLRAMICALNRVELFEAQQAGWWCLEHMGGFGDVEKRVQELRSRQPGPARLFVLVDSDRKYPGHLTGTARKVEECSRATGVPYVILRKRNIENYLPAKILESVDKRASRAFAKLTQIQKDHYNVKKGFRGDRFGEEDGDPEQARLFHGVMRPVIERLLEGFGSDVSSRFEAEKDSISESDVREVCAGDPSEVDRMLDLIETLI
jgi:hypothetical protein